MKATELMAKFGWTSVELVDMFLSEEIYTYYDGEIEWDI